MNISDATGPLGASSLPSNGAARLDTSTLASDSMECWICRDSLSTAEDPLVTGVCMCRGSVGSVHQRCIDQWVLTKRRTRCPSCDATYNVISNTLTEPPTTLLGELLMLFWGLFVPLCFKFVQLVLGAAVNGVVVPCIIGAAYYRERLCRLHPYLSQMAHWFGVVGINSDISQTSSNFNTTTLEGVSIGEKSVALTSFAEDRFWLLLSVFVYGAICTAMWRGMRAGWRQWLIFFNRNPNHVEETPWQPFTNVECAHWVLDSCMRWAGCSRTSVMPRIVELSILVPLSVLLSSPKAKLGALGVFLVFAVIWRLVLTRKEIRDPLHRLAEVQDQMGNATDTDITLWFITYISEMAFFSIAMPLCGGIVIHFAVMPFLLPPPNSFLEFIEGLSLMSVVMYWLMGTTCSIILMQVELTVIVPLFAPGVDLFFIRSVDIRLEGESIYWNFILGQLYDGDPLRIAIDFLRMCIYELIALYLFVSLPLRISFMVYTRLNLGNELTLPLPVGFPVSEPTPYTGEWESHFLIVSLRALLGGMGLRFSPIGIFSSFLQTLLWVLTNPTLLRWCGNSLLFVGVGTAIVCLKVYPLQWIQLKTIRPIVGWLTGNIFGMENFLFDYDRLEVLDRWLGGNGHGELEMPEVPLGMVFVRRERLVPREDLPRLLKLRLYIFSLLFFFVTTALFWSGSVLVMTLLLHFLPYGLPVVCASFNFFLFVLNPNLYVSAFAEFMLLVVILTIGLFVQPILLLAPLLDVSRRQLVRETMEYRHEIKRHIGVYVREPSDALRRTALSSSDWEDASTESEEEREEEEAEEVLAE